MLVTRLSEKPNINFSSAYDCSDAADKRKQARREALLDARDKAKEMTDVLGLKPGRTLRIQETPGRESPIFNNAQGFSLARAEALAPGTVSITGSMEYTGWVEVVFELAD
jgi:uncharacterized protein YggE